MSELTDRLRKGVQELAPYEYGWNIGVADQLMKQAADHISGLEAENAALKADRERLIEGLGRFAYYAKHLEHMTYMPNDQFPGSYVTYGDLRRAAALIAEMEKK